MKRIIFFFLLIAFLTSSCSKSEPIFPEVNNQLSWKVYILPQEKVLTRSSCKISFEDSDRVGVLLRDENGNTYHNSIDNFPLFFSLGQWKTDFAPEVKMGGNAYAYYPYREKLSGHILPISLSEQEDILISSSKFSPAHPEVSFSMRHALSLISVRILKGSDYKAEGKLSEVTLINVPSKARLDVISGMLFNEQEVTDYTTASERKLNDSHSEYTKIIALPTSSALVGNIAIRVMVDGNYYIKELPPNTVWEPGRDYQYTLTLPRYEEEEPLLELDVEFWEKYGKDDNIQYSDAFRDLSHPSCDRFSASNAFTEYGRTIVSGEPFVFSTALYNELDNPMSNQLQGEIKYALFQNGRMIEQYPSYSFSCSWYNTLYVPCYVTVPPGDYQLRILVREKGSSQWIIAKDAAYGFWKADYTPYEEWNYRVVSGSSTPSIRKTEMEHLRGEYGILFARLNEPFNMEITVTNRSGIEIAGDVKAIWHREFDGEYVSQRIFDHELENTDKEVWNDEIGYTSIHMSANEKERMFLVPCIITKSHKGKRGGKRVHFYFRAKGSTEWNLMRFNSNHVLERSRKKFDAGDKSFDGNGFLTNTRIIMLK